MCRAFTRWPTQWRASERLKDKLGNRSNASSEAEFFDACGWLIGEEGDGVRQILKMGALTRFDCAAGSHALMRRAYSVSLYHALQRQAFGKNLADQPMMRQVLGQMALRLEGQTAFLFRLARAWDRRDDAHEVLWARLFTPVAKFAICRAGIPFVAEAMEVLGGIGYCEESELPRLYREMPVNSIWEGSGNIMCLDVMRVLGKQPVALEMLAAECAEVKGQNRHYDRAWRQLQQLLRRPVEAQGREIARLVYCLGAGAQMLRFASPPLAQAWCRMMLDTRGSVRLDAQLLDDALLRAWARTTAVSGVENSLHSPAIRLRLFIHLNDTIPGSALLIGFYSNGVLDILLTAGDIIDGNQTNFVQAGDAIRTGEFG